MKRLIAFCLFFRILPVLVALCATGSLAAAEPSTLDGLVAGSPKLLADGFAFAEGPAADLLGNVYFTDFGKNRIHYWDASAEKLVTVREDSGGADGLFVDRHGDVLICELKRKRLTKLSQDGSYQVLLDQYERKLFTGPNDLWIDPHSGVYFSDSYAGSQKRGRTHRVFYLSPSGNLELVADQFFKSNGLQGTLDGKWLYVSDYIENLVYRYELLEPGKVGERTVFARYRCDGMTLDDHGNLYLCTGNAGHGIVVFSPEGRELGKMRFPENPANVCFGGANRQTLYVAATHGFYSVEMKVQGSRGNSPQEPIFTDQGGLDDLVQGAAPEKLASGFGIAQGPAADAQGNVHFSDIYHHRIMSWDFADRSLQVVREQPGGPDGLFFESDGSLLVCELLGRRFMRLSIDGKYELVTDRFNGKQLTGPNDVYVDGQGGIYFSDSYPGSKIRTPDHCVYYLAPGASQWKLMINDHYKTKGIHESKDGKWLYVADYGARKVFRYELKSPGVLGKKELFVDTRCGGLTVDQRGNVYLSTVGDRQGILVFSPDGKPLGKIAYPEATTNVTFAGPHHDQLIATTFKSLYSLDMKVKGFSHSGNTGKGIE